MCNTMDIFLVLFCPYFAFAKRLSARRGPTRCCSSCAMHSISPSCSRENVSRRSPKTTPRLGHHGKSDDHVRSSCPGRRLTDSCAEVLSDLFAMTEQERQPLLIAADATDCELRIRFSLNKPKKELRKPVHCTSCLLPTSLTLSFGS